MFGAFYFENQFQKSKRTILLRYEKITIFCKNKQISYQYLSSDQSVLKTAFRFEISVVKLLEKHKKLIYIRKCILGQIVIY